MDMKGFTLLEVMIVIAILGVIASIAFANFMPLKRKAYDITALTDTRNLADSIVNAALDNEDVDFSEFNAQGEVGIKDTSGVLRAPVFYFSPGVAARITQAAGDDMIVQAEIYHTNGTPAGSPSGRKEYTVIVDETSGLVSLP